MSPNVLSCSISAPASRRIAVSGSSMSSADAIHVSMTVSFSGEFAVCLLSSNFRARRHAAPPEPRRQRKRDSAVWRFKPSMAIPYCPRQSAEDDFGCQRGELAAVEAGMRGKVKRCEQVETCRQWREGRADRRCCSEDAEASRTESPSEVGRYDVAVEELVFFRVNRRLRPAGRAGLRGYPSVAASVASGSVW